MAKMDLSDLRSRLGHQIEDATGYIEGDITKERQENLDYYYGEKLGNEVKDQSQVVSTDVQDAIESIMPDLVEMFAASDEVISFEPMQPEDEEAARQAADYCRFIWFKDNPGFTIIHDWIKDAAIQKFGVVKQWWDDTPLTRKETFTKVNKLRLEELANDPDVEIKGFSKTDVEDDTPPSMDELMADPENAMADMGPLYDVEIERTIVKGRVRIECIPPEEFLISKRESDLKTADFTAHRSQKTASELIAMGFDKDQVMGLPSEGEHELNIERLSRFNNETVTFRDGQGDKSMRRIQVWECYTRTDFDGDGIAEMRQVYVAGTGYEILKWQNGDEANVEVAEHPFDGASPIRTPHRVFGRAIADQVKDIQIVQSMIQRGILDNVYKINNAKRAVSNKVNIEDVLTNRPGGIERVDTDTPDVAGHVVPIVPVPIAQHLMPVAEFFHQIKESRTGLSRLNQGMDPESLNKTATGINLLLGRTQKRVLLVARLFAEMGFKEAVKKTLRLVVAHQDKARVIRLRNQWVPMDPRNWNPDMDATVSVGLGSGSKEQQAAAAMQIAQIHQQIVELQGGVDGPLVTTKELHYNLKKLGGALGEKDPDRLFSDPTTTPPPQPKPDPEIQKAQMQMQADLMKHQGQMQIDREKMQADIQIEREKMQMEFGLKQAEQGANFQMQQQNAQADREMNTGLEKERIAASAKPQVQLALPDQVAQAFVAMQEQQAQMMQQVMTVLAQAAQTISEAAALSAAPKVVSLQTPQGVKTATVQPMLN